MQLDLLYHHQDVQLPHLLQDVCVEDVLGNTIYTSSQMQKKVEF